MASPPLVDLDSLDLERDIASREELEVYLEQRGRFFMLDGVVHEDAESGIAVGYKDIREDDWWAADHIPGRPLFPGALMVEAAAQLSTYDYLRHRGKVKEGEFVGFGGLDKVRFRGTVTPPSRLYLAISLKRARRQMFVYEAQGFVDGKLIFEAEVIGIIV